MKIVKPSYTILTPCALDAVSRKEALHSIARAARTCYKSTGADDATLVSLLVRNGHPGLPGYAPEPEAACAACRVGGQDK